tara:strand:- start:287 stop:685 length:399 start_codon:yes stop_codon:yes gene_type:complete
MHPPFYLLVIGNSLEISQDFEQIPDSPPVIFEHVTSVAEAKQILNGRHLGILLESNSLDEFEDLHDYAEGRPIAVLTDQVCNWSHIKQVCQRKNASLSTAGNAALTACQLIAKRQKFQRVKQAFADSALFQS